MYGVGLRLKEALCLRVQDIDFGHMEITVRHGKGGKDRRSLLPKASVETLRIQIESARLLHQKAFEEGACFVHLPHALARKYPNAGKELAWQYIFANAEAQSTRFTIHP
ncbi:tyrosine-type recombinase/integrase [Endozoicomonas sp. ONNA2]|uniref:tyrosine-type recombinase/integrase n=1 Tax=Endozoicomonas sp. ONNA2 TaxID=2828741 RepID=UPI0021481803|nr:tyrosine-type recombinase/integrase [Endozoicomonas sp. ONNA2]